MLIRGFVVFSDCLCAMIAMSAMEKCSKEQCVLIVKTHYQNGEHYTVTVFVWKPHTILEHHNAWGYTMSRVYQNKARNILELKPELRRVFKELIDETMCDRAMVNFMERTIDCRASKGEWSYARYCFSRLNLNFS